MNKFFEKENIEPPDELDGANVIQWAWSGVNPFGYIYSEDGKEKIEIYGIALCCYSSTDVYYRFSCDINWEVMNDSFHDSIEQAIKQLPDQYKNIKANWQIK